MGGLFRAVDIVTVVEKGGTEHVHALTSARLVASCAAPWQQKQHELQQLLSLEFKV